MTAYRIFWWRDRQAPHASEYSVIRSCPGKPDESVSTHPTVAEAKAAIQALEKPSPVRLKPATVPICDECWVKAAPKVIPVRLKVPQEEACNDCGARTSSGIYVRRLIEDK